MELECVVDNPGGLCYCVGGGVHDAEEPVAVVEGCVPVCGAGCEVGEGVGEGSVGARADITVLYWQ